MKTLAMLATLTLLMASAAAALTPEEVIRLKKAGVSDKTIQLMLEQERAGGGTPEAVEDTSGEVVYRAGQNTKADMDRNARHEAWKEKKSLEAVGGVIIDQRKGR